MNQSKIFIIDDNKEVCESIKFFLNVALNHEVEIYCNPVTFLKKFSPENDGCIIVDLYMPYMNGITFIQRIKKINNKVKVILFSGNAHIDNEFKEVGADAFIKKPFKTSEFLEIVSELLK